MKSLFLIFTIISLCFSSKIFGCTCLNNNSIIEDYNEASIIFVGNVISHSDTNGYLFTVQNNFKGALNSVVYVNTGLGGGDCGYPFKIGESYLVFAYEHNLNYYTDICTRTAEYSNSKLNLIFLDNLPQSLETSYVFGNIVYWSNHEQRFSEVTKLIKQRITLISKELTLSSFTDGYGEFLFKDVPLGKYSVKIDYGEGLVLSNAEDDTINLMRNDCYYFPLALILPCTLVISLKDSQNNVVGYDDVSTSLIPEAYNQIEDLYFGPKGYISRDGDKIVYDRMPPGNYVLGLNTSYGPSSYSPYPSTYYPNAKDFDNAEVIELSEEKRIVEVEMVLPKLKTYYIKGKIITNTQKPIPKIFISLGSNSDCDQANFLNGGIVDTDGVFELGFVQDVEGWLCFEMMITEELRNKGFRYKSIKPIKIEKNSNIDSLIILIE